MQTCICLSRFFVLMRFLLVGKVLRICTHPYTFWRFSRFAKRFKNEIVKNTIIEKQEALIDLLYREDTANDEMKALKREVEEKQAVLQKRRDLLPKL